MLQVRLPAMTPAAKRAAMLAGAVSLLAIAATLWRLDLDRQAQSLIGTISGLRTQLRNPPSASNAVPRGPDFAQRLPASVSVDPIVRELQRSSAEEGVVFLSVSSSPRIPTAQTLGRTELSVGLRGAYPRLKSVLAQTLDRFPGLVVPRLSLKRLASPAELEARVDLLLLTRPLAASAASR